MSVAPNDTEGKSVDDVNYWPNVASKSTSMAGACTKIKLGVAIFFFVLIAIFTILLTFLQLY